MTAILLDTVATLYANRRWNKSAAFLEAHGLDGMTVNSFAGSLSIAPITLLPNRRFDLPDHGAEALDGVVIEVIDADGESVIDLVAWPLSNPSNVHTLLGQARMVGLWAALNPGTYTFGYPLVMHRSPLAWMQADCEGTAVVILELAARTFLEITALGGRIGAQDLGHAHELEMMLLALVDQVEIVIPKMRKAA